MVNYDRIVPVEKIDLLSLYGTILNIANISYYPLECENVEGNFIVEANSTYLACQPVKTLDFGEATAATVYFVAAYDYKEIKINGETVSTEGHGVMANGATLHKAVLADSAVTVSLVTPDV